MVTWGWCDFNQGLDAALMTDRHAAQLARIGHPMIRLALDSRGKWDNWERAFNLLRSAGIAKHNIRTYALVGYNDTPRESWERCLRADGHGVKVLPQWFHRLDAMEANVITDNQKDLGWTHRERRNLMGWFYKHRGAKGPLGSL